MQGTSSLKSSQTGPQGVHADIPRELCDDQTTGPPPPQIGSKNRTSASLRCPEPNKNRNSEPASDEFGGIVQERRARGRGEEGIDQPGR